MSRLGVTSKFRHVFPTVAKVDDQYRDIKLSGTISDLSSFIAANAKYYAVAWYAGGGGKLAVLELDKKGKVPNDVWALTGHSAPVTDWAFHPFAQQLIATVSEDCTAKIWAIPEEGLTANIDTPLTTLTGHSKKVTMLQFHHVANHTLATVGMDHLIKLWDIEAGERLTVNVHKDQITAIDFNLEGNCAVTVCKDKKIRIVDLRANTIVAETGGHLGNKAAKGLWAKRKEKIITVGFNKTERQVYLWDPRKFDSKFHEIELDNASGVMMTFFDEDTNMLYLGGKGDGNIRYFELWENQPPLVPLSEYTSGTPQRGLCMLPKVACDTTVCEVARFLKLENDKVIPISFQCPRKQAAQEFQTDVYPDTFSIVPTITAAQYFSGTTCPPNTMAMQHTNGRPTGGSSIQFTPSADAPKSPSLPKGDLEAQKAKVEALRNQLAAEEKKLKEMEDAFAALQA